MKSCITERGLHEPLSRSQGITDEISFLVHMFCTLARSGVQELAWKMHQMINLLIVYVENVGEPFQRVQGFLHSAYVRSSNLCLGELPIEAEVSDSEFNRIVHFFVVHWSVQGLVPVLFLFNRQSLDANVAAMQHCLTSPSAFQR